MIIRKTQKRSEQSTQLLTPTRTNNPSRQQTHRPERTAFQQLIFNPRTQPNEKPSGNSTRRNSRMFTLGSLQKDHSNQSSVAKRRQGPPSESVSKKLCAKHPNKQATHYILNEATFSTLYCEKCSIELASKGCHMGKIVCATERRKYDETDLDRFMGNLNSVLNELIRRKEESTINIIKCETEYGRQIEFINDYFANLQFTLELEKNKHYTSILNTKKEVEAELKRLYRIYENCIIEMNRILDNIVLGRRSSSSCYDSILEEYSPKIKKYNEIIKADQCRFSVKQIKLVDSDQIQEILQNLLQIQYEHKIQNNRTSRTPLNTQPAERESNVKTIVTEYRSGQYQPEQQQQSETNLITQHSDIDLDMLLASVASPR